ncbi:MAG: hypothetical protein KKB95_16585 [Gammaproteobacteria bacterium]|jgi:hypothetical protein|nr:hypothetical protein [Gammaproteobacteria bacterium]MBU1353485.1 hypothetical protein [Gammaproteobacteria bacterium]MBU1508437.1 hypothetical protein [Gammaproteobacteria bacterium]MBU2120147.1 hypothetical protein [Gammaproteobacteria bacterium]MBU2171604.1 hypothetical protein [Gammaproteobacteria bacterium]
MKLFSFPAASLEKAIYKRVLTLPSPHREWFTERWQQKPYKKAFIDNKAMPLVTLVAKGKTLDDAEFDELLQEWEVTFYDAEEEVLRPLIQGDGLLQLMQKNLPAARVEALLAKLTARRAPAADAAAPPSTPSPQAAEPTIN